METSETLAGKYKANINKWVAPRLKVIKDANNRVRRFCKWQVSSKQ